MRLAAVDGRRDSVLEAARKLAPGGLDAALVLANGKGISEALGAVKKGGRARYWDPVPYETWDCAGNVIFPSNDQFRRYLYGGSTFDTIHNKYLLVQMWADAGYAGIVQVYGYKPPTPSLLSAWPSHSMTPTAVGALLIAFVLSSGLRRRPQDNS